MKNKLLLLSLGGFLGLIVVTIIESKNVGEFSKENICTWLDALKLFFILWIVPYVTYIAIKTYKILSEIPN